MFEDVMNAQPGIGGRYFPIIITWVLGVFAIYMLSLGPVAGFCFRNRAPSMGTPRWLAVTYKPAEVIWHSMPHPIEEAYGSYLEWCIVSFPSK